jgi:PAS domain S-box-containing protein
MIFHRTKEDIVNTLTTLTGLNPGILEIIRRTTRMNLGLTVPLYLGDPEAQVTPIGILAISSIKTDVDEEDLRVVRILADQASLAIHNVHLIQRLERHADKAVSTVVRIKDIMDSAHDMIISYDPSGSVNFTNTALRGSRVYSTEGELIDKVTLDRVHPEDQPALVEAYLALKDSRPIAGIEYRIRDENGDCRHHNLNAATVLDTDGRVREIVAFIRDVTHERERDQQVVRRNKELEILNSLIINLNSDIGFDEMISRSLSVIGDFTGSEIVSLLSLVGPDSNQINVVGHKWLPKEFEEFVNQDLPKQPVTEGFFEDDLVILKDLTNLPGLYSEFMKKYSIEVIVSIPVKYRGEKIGYVVTGSKRSFDLDEEDIAMLRAVGDQLGLVLKIGMLMKASGSTNGSE